MFNILIGLGLGFSSLSSITGSSKHEVKPSKSITVGVIFIILNIFLVLFTGLYVNSGVITKEYGYVALGLYGVYVVVSILIII